MAKARGGRPAEIELRLLGPLEVVRDGEPVVLGGPKPGALLAVLALDVGHGVSGDLLIEALWPSTPPETAAHAVQVYVSQLRKALGAGTITRRGAGYALELDSDRVDARRFALLASEGRELLAGHDAAGASTVLRKALGLWRGPALADFTYEPFAQTEIARLEELRVDAVEARVDADLTLGRHVDLVPELEALVRSHPLREHPRAQLMLALYRSGRQADALAAYRAARETLVGELGIDPSPELRELEASILRQDESLLLADSVSPMPSMQFRRLVSILSVDVVGAMALGETLDAEALADVQRWYLDAISRAVTRHGGSIEAYAGDVITAAFGIPVSHEDDAIRAVRAALDVRVAIDALNEHLPRKHAVRLEVRIGIAAGEVVASSTEHGRHTLAGAAMGISASLRHAATAGEIVVGEVVARLVDHLAHLEPLGVIEIPGRQKPLRMFRLTELVVPALVFAGRLDAPFVGRTQELASLRRALKSAIADGAPKAALVVGPAGEGKSRLAAELVRRARGIRALSGRCLPYGDGITYWPLREAAGRAPETDERDALLEALVADPPSSAAEIALLFRRFCEATAHERPLVLIFDDVHWAEPTLLELIEGTVDRSAGPILVTCLARDDFLEDRPTFLDGRESVDRILLQPLARDQAESVLDGLGGAVLDTDHRERIVDRAEGNPLFLQQLLAHALEGGLGGDALPPTVQALLAARLDRLGPGERAVLERGAVVGREFTTGDVVALLDPEAVPSAAAHLGTLAERGFVRPLDRTGFAFRHGLVQEAAYRAAPKRLRAELHERFADRLDEAYSNLPDLDEFAGYHLEQAYRLRSELGESARQTVQLAAEAGRRLGEAGVRALKRGDIDATISLLGRATAILPRDERGRGILLCEYAVALEAAQESEKAVEVLTGLVESSHQPSDFAVRSRARIELGNILMQRDGAADEVLATVEEAAPTLERLREHRALGRALLISGWIRGGHLGDHTAWNEAASRALDHYQAASWPTSTCLGQIGAAMYWGPAHADDAIARIRDLLADPGIGREGAAYLSSFHGGLLAYGGLCDEGRMLVTSARALLEDLGLRSAALTYCVSILADVELLAGDLQAAEACLQEYCSEARRTGNRGELAECAGRLAGVLLTLGLDDEAEEWIDIAERHAAPDDVNAQMMWRPARARLLAGRGELDAAERLAWQAVRLSEPTDWLDGRAQVETSLAEVLRVAGRFGEAATAFVRAAELYERKGNVVAAARACASLEELTPV